MSKQEIVVNVVRLIVEVIEYLRGNPITIAKKAKMRITGLTKDRALQRPSP